MWSTTPDGTADFMNRAWRDFTGFSAEDAVCGRWVESLHPDEADWVQSSRKAAIAAGRADELDARLRRSDGTCGWVLRRAVLLRNERGDFVRWYGTAGTDIDDLKRAEVALREIEGGSKLHEGGASSRAPPPAQLQEGSQPCPRPPPAIVSSC